MTWGAIQGYGEGQVPPAHIDQAPLIVCAVMLGCSWVTTMLRLYTRTCIVYAFGWDDLLMILSLASFTVYSGCEMYVSLKRNLLDHMALPTLQSAIEAYLLHLIFYVVALMFLKLSVGFFLMRIAIRKIHIRIIYATMFVSTLWGLVTCFVVIFQCGALRSIPYYILQRVMGSCIPGEVNVGIGYSWAAVTAATDIIFTALPLFVLRDTQINRRAKILLGALLTLGALGSLASLVRFAYVKELKTVNNRFFLDSMQLGIWSSLECGLSISAASLAALRPMFRIVLKNAQTIGTRTKESLSTGFSRNGNGSGRRDTINLTESYPRSFSQRFSVSNIRRATMWSTSTKRSSGMENIEANHASSRTTGGGQAFAIATSAPLPEDVEEGGYDVYLMDNPGKTGHQSYHNAS